MGRARTDLGPERGPLRGVLVGGVVGDVVVHDDVEAVGCLRAHYVQEALVDAVIGQQLIANAVGRAVTGHRLRIGPHTAAQRLFEHSRASPRAWRFRKHARCACRQSSTAHRRSAHQNTTLGNSDSYSNKELCITACGCNRAEQVLRVLRVEEPRRQAPGLRALGTLSTTHGRSDNMQSTSWPLALHLIRWDLCGSFP